MPRMTVATPNGKKMTTTNIANAIRNELKGAYEQNIPIATGDNLRDVANAILADSNYVNQFIQTLLNRIGRTFYMSKVWNNPLKKFKEGLLEYGEVAQEIFVNKVRQEPYSMWNAENTLYKIAIPDIKAVYYEMNDQTVYIATINESMLRQAFLSEDGLNKLITGIMDRMATQDELHEFEVMKNLFNTYATKNRFYPINVTAVTDETTAKGLIQKIRQTYKDMSFVNTKFNYMGVLNHSKAEDIHLFITTALDALVDVEVLAKAFNMDKTEFLGHITVLDNLGVANAEAILVDRAWFRVYDNKISGDTVYNPKGLYQNHFLHHWETFAVNPFAPAIVFTTQTPAITSVNFVDSTGTAETDFDGLAGGQLQLDVKVVATGGAKKTCDFEITEGADYVAEFTSEGERCLVRIKPNVATGATIKIKATAQMDSTKNDTATITIVDPS